MIFLVCKAKLFAEDTSIFSTVDDIVASSETLNNDFFTVKNWFNGKWLSIQIPTNNLQRSYFSHKKKPVDNPVLFFNDAPIATSHFQKHLVLILDENFNFGQHLNEKISMDNKCIGLSKRLRPYLTEAEKGQSRNIFQIRKYISNPEIYFKSGNIISNPEIYFKSRNIFQI